MPSDQSFDHFYANISRKSEGLLGKPTLLRNRCTSARLDVGAGTPSYSQTAKDHFRRVYCVLLILSSVLSIRKASAPPPRWTPSWLKLLMVTTMRQSSSFLKHHTERMLIQARYPGMQLSILEVMLQEKIACFDEILKAVSKFPKLEEKLIQESQTICKLPPVNPATSVAGERSFSSARHLKTWLLSRMGDPAVLHGHKRRTDSISITTQEFVFRNRKRSFGTSGNFKKQQPQEVCVTYWLYWIV